MLCMWKKQKDGKQIEYKLCKKENLTVLNIYLYVCHMFNNDVNDLFNRCVMM